MNTKYLPQGTLAIALASGMFGGVQAAESFRDVRKLPSEFVLNYDVGRVLELETLLKQLDVDKNARIASGINNRLQANLGVNWKPAKWLNLRPGIRYGWFERYGSYTSELSSKHIQFSLDAVFRF